MPSCSAPNFLLRENSHIFNYLLRYSSCWASCHDSICSAFPKWTWLFPSEHSLLLNSLFLLTVLWYYLSLRSEKLISIFNFSFVLTLSHLVFCHILHFFFLHHASPFCDFLSILSAALLVQDLSTSSWTRNRLFSDAWLTSPPAHPVDRHQTDLVTPIPRSLRSVSMAYWIKLKSLTGL